MGPKVLFIDIETSPILGYVWGLWENNLDLSQIKNDWHLLSWSAKWKGDPSNKVMYMDQRNAKNIEDDSKILTGVWNLLDETDIIVTQNGKSFDEKKLNARFILNGMKPPSPFKHIDTMRIAKKRFAFTSNKLAYMSEKLCKNKKLKHKKFPGFELWTECLKGNKEAWNEMRKYNIMDVIALEELYNKLQPWDNTINFSAYTSENAHRCNCGSSAIRKKGFGYTKRGRFQRYVCTDCGANFSNYENLLSKEKRKSILNRL